MVKSLAVFSGNYRAQILAENNLTPFWGDGIEPETKKERIESFIRKIYPIWGKILSEWEMTFVDEKTESETAINHRIEADIYRSGHKIDRLSNNWHQSKAKKSKLLSDFKNAME